MNKKDSQYNQFPDDPGRKNCQDDQEVVLTPDYKVRKDIEDCSYMAPEFFTKKFSKSSSRFGWSRVGSFLKGLAYTTLIGTMVAMGAIKYSSDKAVEEYQTQQEQRRISNLEKNDPELLKIWDNWSKEASEGRE